MVGRSLLDGLGSFSPLSSILYWDVAIWGCQPAWGGSITAPLLSPSPLSPVHTSVTAQGRFPLLGACAGSSFSSCEHRLSLVVNGGGYSWPWCAGFSLQWPLLLPLGSRAQAQHGLSCSVAYGIFLDQGWNQDALQGGFLTTWPPRKTSSLLLRHQPLQGLLFFLTMGSLFSVLLFRQAAKTSNYILSTISRCLWLQSLFSLICSLSEIGTPVSLSLNFLLCKVIAPPLWAPCEDLNKINEVKCLAWGLAHSKNSRNLSIIIVTLENLQTGKVERKSIQYCTVLSHSVVSNSATPWTVAHQVPLSVGILQARILKLVAMPSSRGSSWPRDQTQVSHIEGWFFTI